MSAYPRPAVPAGHVEPCPRRIRARLGARTVLDTTRALYLWEHAHYPTYVVPAADVDPTVLVTDGAVTEDPHGAVRAVALRDGRGTRAGAGRRVVRSVVPGLVDGVLFAWDALDAWYEEDEQVHVHPRSPYVRVDAVRASRHVRVTLEGVLLAESTAPVLLFETGLPPRTYIDPTDVDPAHLEASDTVTACPYKGVTSRWWSVRTPSGAHRDLVWCYDHPAPAVARIAGLVAFFDERVDLTVDGVPRPRPVTHMA